MSQQKQPRRSSGCPASDAGSDRAMRPREFLEFPRDHGPHFDYRTEWWYVTSVLATDSGREYGVQFTLFRSSMTNSQETDNPWRTSQMYMGHLALSDVGRRKHVEAQRIARGHPQLAGVNTEPFHAYIEDWSVRSQIQSFFPLELFGRTGEFEIALEIDSTKPIVLQGDEGLSRKSPEHFSYYYSIPRMKTRGKLTIGDEVQSVSGYSWLDREWSNGLLSDRYQGWYWFALSFDDGTDMVIFSLLDRADGFGPESSGNRRRQRRYDDEFGCRGLVSHSTAFLEAVACGVASYLAGARITCCARLSTTKR